MKILWLAPIFPYPPYSGGQTRSFNLIKNLARNHQITLLAFWRPNRLQGPIKAMAKYCQPIKTFPGRPIWSVRNLSLAAFSGLPLTITHFYGDRSVTSALQKELVSQKYDLAHFESFYTSPYLTENLGVPTVLGNENVEYRVYQRFGRQKKFPLSLILQLEVAKMKRFEQAAWCRADLNLAVSGVDAQAVRQVTGKKCWVIPNGVDLSHFQRFKSRKRRQNDPFILLFVGDFKYFTNQDAFRLLVEKVWPKVASRCPEATLRLVGRHPNDWIKGLASKKIIVDTGVDDIRQAYGSADVLLAPMRIASGTNLKILEAMAAGLPVVTTSVGIEGIRAKTGRDALVADDPDQLAYQVISLLKNVAQRQQLSAAGQKIVKQHYDWPQITKTLEKAYEGLINYHS